MPVAKTTLYSILYFGW